MDALQSLKSPYAQVSLCKSLAKALLDAESSAHYLDEADEAALYSCCHTYGTKAAIVRSRVNKIINRMLTGQALRLITILDDLKPKHVMKRDKQRMTAWNYRQRNPAVLSRIRKGRYIQWVTACEDRANGEAEVLDALHKLSNAASQLLMERQAVHDDRSLASTSARLPKASSTQTPQASDSSTTRRPRKPRGQQSKVRRVRRRSTKFEGWI